jgi:5-methylcytosine-specific restriction endonuclease McrA
MNKTELNKLLVDERKKMRLKQKESDFMRKSLSVYNGQKKRAADLNKTIPFDIDTFRSWLKPKVDTECTCGTKMTLKRLAIDHKVPIARGGGWSLDNLACICQPCNFRKGQLLPDEFDRLREFAQTLTPESREDLWRRLTLGGKWSFGK